jgi:hypothetical protein
MYVSYENSTVLVRFGILTGVTTKSMVLYIVTSLCSEKPDSEGLGLFLTDFLFG